MKKIPLWKKILAKLFWMVLGVIVLTLIVALDETWKVKSGRSEYAEGYTVNWNAFNYYMSLKKDRKTLVRFQVPKRPLAVWYRPSTGTVAVVASENGLVTDNHLLYLWKEGRLRILYHAVEGVNQKTSAWSNSWLFPLSSEVDPKDSVYLSPNELLMVARETNGYGYTPRVFDVSLNGLNSGVRYSWDSEDVYWSSNGRCMIVLGDGEDAWGYFEKPYDFIYLHNGIDVENRTDTKIKWASENPCEAYISLHGDKYGGEGSPTILDKNFFFVVGERFGEKVLTTLPKGFEQMADSMKDDWQMVMVTYP